MTSRSRKTALQNHKLWSDGFFPAESDGEGPRLKYEQEDGQTDGEEMARASFCNAVVPPRLHAQSRERFEMFMIN